MSHVEPEHSKKGCPECGETNGHAVTCSHLWDEDGMAALRLDQSYLDKPVTVEQCLKVLAAERKKIRTLVETLNFFKSVIQSGEQWTPTCQRAYDDALPKP